MVMWAVCTSQSQHHISGFMNINSSSMMAKPKPFPGLQFGLFETGSHYSAPVGLELVNQEALKLRN